MPPYPDEIFPAFTLSLHEFNEKAYNLLVAEHDDPLKPEFVNLVLAGRCFAPSQDEEAGQEEEIEHRVHINVRQGLASAEDKEFNVTRDYDSIIGITENLPFRVPLAIYPIPNFKESLSGSIHITKMITSPVSTPRMPKQDMKKSLMQAVMFSALPESAKKDKNTPHSPCLHRQNSATSADDVVFPQVVQNGARTAVCREDHSGAAPHIIRPVPAACI